MMVRIEFTVIGNEKIQCIGCEMRIRFALKRISGVQHVMAGAEIQRVAVTFDPALLSPEHIQDRLKELGFDTEEVS